MGMYTEFELRFRLKQDTPENVFLALDGKTRLDNDFFRSDRCDVVLWDVECVGEKSYTVHSELKNYDHEIEKFVEWISPHLDHRQGEQIGWWYYEEWLDIVPIYHGEEMTFGCSKFYNDVD